MSVNILAASVLKSRMQLHAFHVHCREAHVYSSVHSQCLRSTSVPCCARKGAREARNNSTVQKGYGNASAVGKNGDLQGLKLKWKKTAVVNAWSVVMCE